MAVWPLRFLHKRKVRKELAAVMPHKPTSPNAYAPTDVALGLLGGVICGADKLSRVAYLRQDPPSPKFWALRQCRANPP